MSKKRREGRRYTLAARHRECNINLAKIEKINYKDVEFLESFITEKGKIIPGRLTGINAKHQDRITRAVKLARNIALLSFAEGYVNPIPFKPDENNIKAKVFPVDTKDIKIENVASEAIDQTSKEALSVDENKEKVVAKDSIDEKEIVDETLSIQKSDNEKIETDIQED